MERLYAGDGLGSWKRKRRAASSDERITSGIEVCGDTNDRGGEVLGSQITPEASGPEGIHLAGGGDKPVAKSRASRSGCDDRRREVARCTEGHAAVVACDLTGGLDGPEAARRRPCLNDGHDRRGWSRVRRG